MIYALYELSEDEIKIIEEVRKNHKLKQELSVSFLKKKKTKRKSKK